MAAAPPPPPPLAPKEGANPTNGTTHHIQVVVDSPAAAAAAAPAPDDPSSAKPAATPAAADEPAKPAPPAPEPSAAKPADEKPKPKPTGIRPRGFLLPAIVLGFMTIPILAIFLPVYLTAGNQRDSEATHVENLCNLYPTPARVLEIGQWLVDEGQQNGVSAVLTGRNLTYIQTYYTQLQENCTAVRPYIDMRTT